MQDDPGSGQPKTQRTDANVDRVQTLVRLDRRLGMRLIAGELNIDRVITSDETWCFQYDPETKRRSMQWKTQNSPRPKKARMSRSQFKTMLVCFFHHKWIVHYEFIAQGQTVNQQCYLEVLTRLWESVRRKDTNSGLTSGLSTTTMPLRMMRYEFASSWLRNPLQKWTIHLT
jgi:hypothetical protein